MTARLRDVNLRDARDARAAAELYGRELTPVQAYACKFAEQARGETQCALAHRLMRRVFPGIAASCEAGMCGGCVRA